MTLRTAGLYTAKRAAGLAPGTIALLHRVLHRLLLVENDDNVDQLPLIALLHRVLHRLLRDAVRLGLAAQNPCALVAPPRALQEAHRALSVAEARQLLAAARGDRLEALWVLALTTGLRRGELLGLR